MLKGGGVLSCDGADDNAEEDVDVGGLSIGSCCPCGRIDERGAGALECRELRRRPGCCCSYDSILEIGGGASIGSGRGMGATARDGLGVDNSRSRATSRSRCLSRSLSRSRSEG